LRNQKLAGMGRLYFQELNGEAFALF